MVNILFAKPKDRTVPIGNVFEAQYRENMGSKMQEISLMQKIIHWFMNRMVVKRRDIRNTSDSCTLVNRQVPSKIRSIVSIVQMLEKEDKTYLSYDCELPSVSSVKYSTWFSRVQSAFNNSCKLALEYCNTKQKWLY